MLTYSTVTLLSNDINLKSHFALQTWMTNHNRDTIIVHLSWNHKFKENCVVLSYIIWNKYNRKSRLKPLVIIDDFWKNRTNELLLVILSYYKMYNGISCIYSCDICELPPLIVKKKKKCHNFSSFFFFIWLLLKSKWGF